MNDTPLYEEESGFFSVSDEPQPGILPLQIAVGGPDIDGLERSTGLLNPPLTTAASTLHFPDDLYDMRPQSHLVRLLNALLGDSGAGQLQKRNMVSRISSTLAGSHFYDLDGLYGSIFGEHRRSDEQLPFDPTDSVATSAEWDEIEARDAKYRSRIEALAKAIPMGGTVPGIQQAAEAIVSAPCQVYEVWKFLEIYGGSSVGGGTGIAYAWNDVTHNDDGTVHWDSLDGLIWSEVTGEVVIGRSEIDTAAEFVVRPIKPYPATPEGDQERAEDTRSLNQVISKLKPAGSLLTVDDGGVEIHQELPIYNIASNENFWEVVGRVSPRPVNGVPVEALYAVSAASGLGVSQDVDGMRLMTAPPMSGSAGHRGTAITEAVFVQGYTLEDPSPTNWDPSGDFTPDQGLADVRTIQATLMSSDNSLIAHPYAGPRLPSMGA